VHVNAEAEVALDRPKEANLIPSAKPPKNSRLRVGFKVLGGAALACAVSLIALRLWVEHRIEISLAQPVICLTPRDRAAMKTGVLSSYQRDLWVIKNAEFGDEAPPLATPWWHVKGLLIEAGYKLLWSDQGRAAEFERVSSRMRDCPAPNYGGRGAAGQRPRPSAR
jgi:hypothetical protein